MMAGNKQLFYAVAQTAHWTVQCPTLRRTMKWTGKSPQGIPLQQAGRYGKCSTCWPYEPAEAQEARRASGR